MCTSASVLVYLFTGSEGESGDFTRRTHRKRCCVVVAIVLVALLLIAALVLGLYFGCELYDIAIFL